MNIFGDLISDVGTKMSANQDAALLRVNAYAYGDIALLVVCDGMGGEKYGELASALIVKALNQWFDSIDHTLSIAEIKDSLYDLLQQKNQQLYNYYLQRGYKIGSTISLMYIQNSQYLIFNIGDSRIYHLNQHIEQLTVDDSLVNNLLLSGKISLAEAEGHPQANVLTQCMGITDDFSPHMYVGQVSNQDVFVLCSDGFWKSLTGEKIKFYFQPELLDDLASIRSRAERAIANNKFFGETDNITVLACKCQLADAQSLDLEREKINLISCANVVLD